jgi:hypothetical protein
VSKFQDLSDLEDDQMDMDWVSFIDGVDDVPILD